jgi:hypothetical protein
MATFGDYNKKVDDDYGNDYASSQMNHPSMQHRYRGGGHGSHDDPLERNDPLEEDDPTRWWEKMMQGAGAGGAEEEVPTMLRRWIEFGKLGWQMATNEAFKVVTAQRHPYLSAIFTVLVLLVIHYRGNEMVWRRCARRQ